ncbi:MAG TPA: hypothetical protein DCZ76_14050 [Treponema sp.]|nr:hypothetical protein [Treponema sp.]
MTREEFESRRADYQSRVNDMNAQQSIRDEEYQEKLESGEVSGFDKLCHGIGKFLQGCVNQASKVMDRY